jgi:hypothetical protein
LVSEALILAGMTSGALVACCVLASGLHVCSVAGEVSCDGSVDDWDWESSEISSGSGRGAGRTKY